MGCQAALVKSPMNKEAIQTKTIHHTYSQAWRLGSGVLKAQKEKDNPIDVIVKHAGGKLLCTGKVVVYLHVVE